MYKRVCVSVRVDMCACWAGQVIVGRGSGGGGGSRERCGSIPSVWVDVQRRRRRRVVVAAAATTGCAIPGEGGSVGKFGGGVGELNGETQRDGVCGE